MNDFDADCFHRIIKPIEFSLSDWWRHLRCRGQKEGLFQRCFALKQSFLSHSPPSMILLISVFFRSSPFLKEGMGTFSAIISGHGFRLFEEGRDGDLNGKGLSKNGSDATLCISSKESYPLCNLQISNPILHKFTMNFLMEPGWEKTIHTQVIINTSMHFLDARVSDKGLIISPITSDFLKTYFFKWKMLAIQKQRI